MDTYTCTCKVHTGKKSVTFEAPEGYLDALKGKARTDAIHNYAFMVINPVMAPSLAARGVKRVG